MRSPLSAFRDAARAHAPGTIALVALSVATLAVGSEDAAARIAVGTRTDPSVAASDAAGVTFAPAAVRVSAADRAARPSAAVVPRSASTPAPAATATPGSTLVPPATPIPAAATPIAAPVRTAVPPTPAPTVALIESCPSDWFCYPRVGVSGAIVPYTDCAGGTDIGVSIRSFTCLSPQYLMGHAYTQFGKIAEWRAGDTVWAYGKAYTVTGAITARSCEPPPLPLAALSMQTSLSPDRCGAVLIVQAR